MPSGPAHLVVDSADPGERGRQRGRFAADPLAASWPTYLDIFTATAESYGLPAVDVRAVGSACEQPLREWSPQLWEEVGGVAAGAGIDPLDVLALNARTEVLAHARATLGECSTVVELAGPTGSAVSIQTWDWHAELASGWHLQRVRGDRYAFVGLTEFGILAKIGVNEAGVGLHFNMLHHRSDASGHEAGAVVGGVPVHLIARRVLGQAGSLAEAVEIIESAPVCASTVLTVVDGSAAVAVEVSPAGAAVVAPENGWLVHTNHFLDSRLATGEGVADEGVTTFDRERLLTERVKGVGRPLDIEGLRRLLDAHDEDGAPVCRHPDGASAIGFRTETLAVIGLDSAARQVQVSAGGPCAGAAMTTLNLAGH